MTNEQAIKELQESHDIMRNHDIDESESYLMQALNMAIKALQTQADGEKTCGTCRNEDTYHCAECENKSDYEQSQADGDLISRAELLKALETWDRFGVDDTNSLFRLDNLSLPHYVAYIHYDDVVKCIKGMPSVAIPPDHDGCEDCRWQSQSEIEMPCKQCMHNYTDEWERAKTGHWIEHPEIETSIPEYLMFYECSECGDKQCFCKSDIHRKRFCNCCGARMVEPQESEKV